jgi:predicted Fe-Mo cluster-binding NifX family protein
MIEKKIAIPVVQGKLSRRFEYSHEFLIATVVNNHVSAERLVYTHLQPELFPYWLANRGVTDIIAHQINHNSILKLHHNKINVFTGVKTTDAELLVKEFLDGTLDTNDILQEDVT